jgi:hypothetical protein
MGVVSLWDTAEGELSWLLNDCMGVVSLWDTAEGELWGSANQQLVMVIYENAGRQQNV